jgi:multidrug resistance efflux pump
MCTARAYCVLAQVEAAEGAVADARAAVAAADSRIKELQERLKTAKAQVSSSDMTIMYQSLL